MRTQKKNSLKQKLLLVALLAGFSSTNSYAVGESTKDGMSLADLSKVVKDLDIRKEENKLIISGFVPARCTQGLYNDYRAEGGKHLITIRMPNCENDFQAKAGEKYVDLADHLPPYSIKDASGEFHLRHYKNVSKNARPEDKQVVELLRDTRSDKSIVVAGSEELSQKEEEARLEQEKKSQEELAREEQLAIEADARAKEEKLARLEQKIDALCRQGDYAGVGMELSRAAKLLGDVSDHLKKLEKSEYASLLKKLEEAETAEEAREIFDHIMQIAFQRGFDTKAVKRAYLEKRKELIEAIVEDAKSGEISLRQAAAAIKAYNSEMKVLDRRAYRGNSREEEEGIKKQVAVLYSELGTIAANNKKLGEAERYYREAQKLSSAEDRMQIDGAMAKIYADTFKKCLDKAKKGKGSIESCDKYMEKAKDKSEAVGDALADADGESSQEDMNAFQVEYVQAFGGGMSMSVPGLGVMNQVPGTFQQAKVQAYQEYQMQQQQMIMQRMMGGGMYQSASINGGGILGLR